MSEPNIPSVPQSLPADQAVFFGAMKSAIELLMGQGRTLQDDRAARYRELSTVQNSLQGAIEAAILPSGDTPDPPTNLIIEKGMWIHCLTWINPTDPIVSHIEIWVAKNTQSRTEAILKGIVTVTDALRGETGEYTATLDDVTADYTYWIRSVSYGGKMSVWEPPDTQGGYVVPGDDTIGETIDAIMAILRGETPPLYVEGFTYKFNNRCCTADNRVWKYINIEPSAGHIPPNPTYWERSGILLVGDVDGIATVGIDGNLVVDGTILARHLQAEIINAGHIDVGDAFVGMTIQSANFDAEAKTGWQISNSGSQFYNGTFTIGAGSTGYDNLDDAPSEESIQQDAQNRADAAQAAAEAASDTLGSASAAYTSAQAYADAADATLKVITDAYADGVADAAELAAINAAQAKADAAEVNANAYADGEITASEAATMTAYQIYADAAENAATVTASAYADGIVTTEEARAIADATAKANTAEANAKAHTDVLENSIGDMAYRDKVAINDMETTLAIAGKIRADVIQTGVFLVSGGVGIDDLDTTLIVGGKITTNLVNANSIVAGSITAIEVGTNQIISTHANIGDLTVTNLKVATLAYLNGKKINAKAAGSVLISKSSHVTITHNLNRYIIVMVSHKLGYALNVDLNSFNIYNTSPDVQITMDYVYM